MPMPRHGPSSWGSKHHGSKTTRASTLCHAVSLIRRMMALKTVRCVFICFYVMRPTRHGRTQKLCAPRWCGQKLRSAWKPVCPPNSKCRPLFILKSLNHAIFTVHNKRTSFLSFWWSFTMRLAHWDESKVEWSTSESSAKSTNPNQLLLRCVGKCKGLRLPGEHWWTAFGGEIRFANVFETHHENIRNRNHGHIVCTVDMEEAIPEAITQGNTRAHSVGHT